LAERVDVVDTENPFILLELDLSAKVVHMSDQGGDDLSVSRLCLRAHKVNDMLCEVWIVFAIVIVDSVGAVRSHDDVLFWGVYKDTCFQRIWVYRHSFVFEEE
jgi:hypothetical protein